MFISEKLKVSAQSVELRNILVKLALRKIEGLNLYRPLKHFDAFHASLAPERIIDGSNRAGKTTAAAAEIARALTGQDPYDKYPKEGGICYCVGKGGREISQKIWPALGRAGAFRIIRDLYTREWRVFDPLNEQDAERTKQSKPAPALLPKRMIQSISYMVKKEDWPKIVTLTNGWKIHFYSSDAKPTQGTDIDLCWFDEEIIEANWYSEMAARLVDRRGRFVWSATPQTGTEQLYALRQRAEKEVENNVVDKSVEAFFCTIADNKHITERDRKLFAAKFAEDEMNYRIRVLGEYAILTGRVFPEYSPRLHEVEAFTPPQTWTRYVAVDPGHQVCACLFMAIPPPAEGGDTAYVYDELYLKGCSAAMFGQEMAKKQQGQNFYAFIIDRRGSRHHDQGSGKGVLEQYEDALAANKVFAQTTRNHFILGDDNVEAGLETIHFWLRLRADGKPKLRVTKNCTNFIKEIKHYRNRNVKGIFIDKPDGKNDHTCDCLRYLVQYNPTWQMSALPAERPNGLVAWWMKQKAKDERANGGGSILLGPGGSGGKRTSAAR